MKKNLLIIFAPSLLLTLLLFSSCKKTTDPEPAGVNGGNGSLFLYRQAGTTLNLSGNYFYDNVSFNNSYDLSFFSTINESSMGEGEVTETGVAQSFRIIRYDRLNNSTLKFILYKDNLGNITIENFHFNVTSDITETTYRNIGIFYNYNAGDLNQTQLNSIGNSFEITNWNYNSTTRALSFDFHGLLTKTCNSTEHDLIISGTVKANLKRMLSRVGQE